jgi:hypothetical protein
MVGAVKRLADARAAARKEYPGRPVRIDAAGQVLVQMEPGRWVCVAEVAPPRPVGWRARILGIVRRIEPGTKEITVAKDGTVWAHGQGFVRRAGMADELYAQAMAEWRKD